MTEKRFYGRAAKVGVAWSFVASGARELIHIPTAVITARLLSPAEFGVAAAASFFLSLASRMTSLGFNAALVRLKDVRPEHASSVFWLNVAVGIGIWLFLAASAPLAGSFLRSADVSKALPVAALSFAVQGFGTVPGALMVRNLMFRQSAFAEWAGVVTSSVLTIWLAWMGFSYWSIVFGTLAGDIVRTAMRLVLCGWRPAAKFSFAALKDLLSFGLGVYVQSLLDYMAQNLDNIVVGRMLGMASLGYYDKAFSTVAKAVSRMHVSGPTVSFRIFSLIREDAERLRRGYRKVLLAIGVLAYPVLAGMAVAAPEVIEVLFGERWLPAVTPFRILCIAGMLRVANTYGSSASQAQGLIWSEVRRQFGYTCLLVVAVAVGCRWGIVGASLGVLVATMTITVLLQAVVGTATGLSPRELLAPLIPGTIGAGIIAVVLIAVKTTISWSLPEAPAAIRLLLLLLAGAVAYAGFVTSSQLPEVRALVLETVDDFSPRTARRLEAVLAWRS